VRQKLDALLLVGAWNEAPIVFLGRVIMAGKPDREEGGEVAWGTLRK